MTTSEAPSAAVPARGAGRRTWLWLLLMLSLALNLLFVGTVVGVSLARRADRALGGAAGDASMMAFVQGLPPERQKAVRQFVKSRQDVMVPLRQDVRRQRMAAARAFLAEPFDAAGFRAAQERLIESETSQRRAQVELQASLAASMSAAERREFLSWRNLMRQKRGLPLETVPDQVPGVPSKDGG